MSLLHRGTTLTASFSLAILAAGLAVVPGLGAQAAPPAAPAAAAPASLVQQMRATADGTVKTSNEPSTGAVGFVRASLGGDLMPSVGASTAAEAKAKADAYLGRFAEAFGASADQLVPDNTTGGLGGWTVSYRQTYRGIPVFGSLLRAHVEKDGALTAVNGFAAPDLTLDTDARKSPEAAAAQAIAFVEDEPGAAANGADTSAAGQLEATSNDLVVYRTGAIKGDVGDNVLTYAVEVSNGTTVREKVFIDADSGKVLNRYSMMDNALDRELREATGTAAAPVLTTVWKEGDPFPGTLNKDQQNLVNSSAESYWFFKNGFNRDSYDGNGAKRITVNNDPRISCPNANWNGTTTNYCNGVTSDDVVAHEWGHAYTEYTWGGIYQWQSGALNEAYSDIWGETTDLINNREDEGEGNLTTKRPVGLCSTQTRGAVALVVNTPASIAGACTTAPAAFGPVPTKTGTTADLVIGADAANPTGPSTTDGCSTFTNASAIAGKFVYVDRGTCTFVAKTDNAVAAGATGIIVGDSVAGRAPTSMSGTASIYGAMVTFEDGARIKSATGPINVTLKDIDAAPKFDSFRWLIGEKATAFGGAIRDMWNPTCYGDPGKVSDVEYQCSTEDQGGVHGNSGVPNHGYALLVDGGTYNGVAVTGLGIDKAANIYYGAMHDYMTPVSDFTDHADALSSSCADLVGKAIKAMSTDPNQSNTVQSRITAADCTQVENMARAVELRKAPVQCDFKPQLDPKTPGVCGTDFTSQVAYQEDFEGGLGAWTLAGANVYGGPTRNWITTTDLPAGNKPAGDVTAAYGPTPDLGTCDGSTADFSSVNTMTSPVITVGAAGGLAPRLSFDHNIQTELGFDGGNLQVAVNGGSFAPVPASAYLFNKPTVLATTAAGNTSPLAGQPGFTGTDGGKILSDWGTSQVDLTKIGVKGGDSVRLRFAVGRDGCGGVNGWWVDNIQVVTCVEKASSALAAVATPAVVGYGAKRSVSIGVAGGSTAPTGTVSISEGSTTLGTATLAAGTATVALPATMSLGGHALSVAYAGDGNYKASRTTTSLTVERGTATLVAKAPKKVKVGNKFTVRATVGAESTTPAGSVVVKLAGKKVGTGVLVDGKVTIKITKSFKAGPARFVVVYQGAPLYRLVTDEVKVRFVRK